MSETVSVTITQQHGYQFLVDFGAGMPSLTTDEPPPLGQDAGPSPTHVLAAALANCLSASLLFALQKYKQDAGGLKATANCVVDRNEEKRLRVVRIDVDIALGADGAKLEHLDRILGQFEQFCTVSQSVQAGIPVKVNVVDGKGARLGPDASAEVADRR
jgi:uncharacterized OsmC-like protein